MVDGGEDGWGERTAPTVAGAVPGNRARHPPPEKPLKSHVQQWNGDEQRQPGKSRVGIELPVELGGGWWGIGLHGLFHSSSFGQVLEEKSCQVNQAVILTDVVGNGLLPNSQAVKLITLNIQTSTK